MPIRVFLVHTPFYRVVKDILTDVVQIVFIADDVFIVIARPETVSRVITQGVGAFGYGGFE